MVRTSKRIRARDLIIDVDYLEKHGMSVPYPSFFILVIIDEIEAGSFIEQTLGLNQSASTSIQVPPGTSEYSPMLRLGGLSAR